RPTVRLRLTAWYSSIFLLGGAVLLAVSYLIVSRNTSSLSVRVGKELNPKGVPVFAVTGGVVGVAPPGVPATKFPPSLVAPLPAPDRGFVIQLEQARTAA